MPDGLVYSYTIKNTRFLHKLNCCYEINLNVIEYNLNKITIHIMFSNFIEYTISKKKK